MYRFFTCLAMGPNATNADRTNLTFDLQLYYQYTAFCWAIFPSSFKIAYGRTSPMKDFVPEHGEP